MNQFCLAGKKAVITGGCNGIGKGIAEAMLEAGCEVAVIDFSTQMETVIEKLSGLGAVHGVHADLIDRTRRKEAFEEAVASLGGTLHILVNCAGMSRPGDFETFSDNDWDIVMELNLNCVFSLCKYASRYMIAQNYGKIINMASMSSFFGGLGVPSYIASKGAIAQMTKGLTNAWGKYGIRINALAPGYIKTQLTAPQQADPVQYEAKRARMPLGRWGTPEDIKGPAVFLASPASDYISGVILPVDGGYLCW